MKQAKIMFYPNTGKLSNKTKQIPIYLRIFRCTTKTEARINASIYLDDLIFWNPITQRFDRPNNNVNMLLENICEEFI